MIMKKKNVLRIALATAFILLLFLVATQFSDAVSWDLTDFAVAGALLCGAGLVYERVAGRAGDIAYRAAVGLAVGAVLLLVWMNLAVGLIGPERNPANLMYIGVLAVGLIGAVGARFRPPGMVRVLLATALVQALVPLMALILGKPPVDSGGALLRMLGVNALFVVLFVGSALLFRRARAEPGPVMGKSRIAGSGADTPLDS